MSSQRIFLFNLGVNIRKIKLIYIYAFFVAFTIFYGINIYKTDFNISDSYLHRLNSGNYGQEDLPEVVQEIFVPTNAKEIQDYNKNILGRLSAWLYVGYFCSNIFGQNPMLWRIPLVILFVLTLLVVYRISLLFNMNKMNAVLFSLLFYILLWQYLIIEHIYDYLLAELFFLLVVFIEFRFKDKKLKHLIIICISVFVSLLFRELTVLAFMPLGIFVFFNLHPFQSTSSKNFNLRGIIPYFLGGGSYFFLYLSFIPQSGIQYSSQLTFELNEIIINSKNEMINVLSLGIVNKHDELIILSLFLCILLFMAIFKYKTVFNYSKKEFSFLVFLGSVVLFYVLGYSFVQTSAYFIPYLAISIIYIMIFQNIIKSYIEKGASAQLIKLIGILMVYLLVGFESLREMELYKAQNKLFYRTSEYIAEDAERNSCIELCNFGIATRFTFVVNNFIRYSRKDLKYKVSKGSYKNLHRDSYAYYHTKPFIDDTLCSDYKVYYNTDKETIIRYKDEPYLVISEKINNYYRTNNRLFSLIVKNNH